MKKNVWVVIFGLLFVTSCIVYVPVEESNTYPPRSQERPSGEEYYDYPSDIDYGHFYEHLSPHGRWIQYAPYGYVWIPRQTVYQWRPYTHGRWAWTNSGWTWISYYKWGWIPFHYGRWGWDRHLGWFWVPGTIWAPAWVTWRWGNMYIGWAPLPPDVEFVAGMGIGSLPYDFPDYYWVFIEGRYFQHDNFSRYVLPFERNRTVVRLTVHKANLSVRNRQLLNQGVDVDHVSQLTGSKVNRYEIEEGQRPEPGQISGDSLRIYRPAVRKNDAAKPEAFLQKEEAETKIPEIHADELEKRFSPVGLEQRLEEEQDQEMRLLRESQEKENTDLKNRIEDEKKLASTPAERVNAEKEGEVRASRLKKEHEEEKAKISERHQEEKKVVKSKTKKKDGA
ncbi:MAG: DUF6600 domain-containing protein [Candidatus Aminicenantales bacterium]